MQLNLSPKTTCLERPYFYGQWGGLSRQVLLYNWRFTDAWDYSMLRQTTQTISLIYNGPGPAFLNEVQSFINCTLFLNFNSKASDMIVLQAIIKWDFFVSNHKVTKSKKVSQLLHNSESSMTYKWLKWCISNLWSSINKYHKQTNTTVPRSLN